MDPAKGNCWRSGKLSPQGFRFVKGYEGYAYNEYKDSEGYRTICYGITYHGEQDIFNQLKELEPVPETYGAQAGYVTFNKRYGAPIKDICINELKLTKQYQFDAIVSLCFNAGVGVITNRKSTLYNRIKANINDREGITEAFKMWVYGDDPSQPLPGLVARREEEAKMFFGEVVKYRPIQVINGKGVIETNKGNGWLPDKC